MNLIDVNKIKVKKSSTLWLQKYGKWFISKIDFLLNQEVFDNQHFSLLETFQQYMDHNSNQSSPMHNYHTICESYKCY